MWISSGRKRPVRLIQWPATMEGVLVGAGGPRAMLDRITLWRLALGAATGAAALGLVIHFGASREARDRYAIRRHLEQTERIIRAHDERIWLRVEASAHPAEDSAHQALHRAILGDFERLAHLEGFAMKDVHVEVGGDAAWARYRVEGEPRPRREQAPAAGEMRFIRGRNGWEMAGHRLIEAAKQRKP